MPLYEYKCDCGKKTQEYKPVKQFDETVFCACGAAMQKVIFAPMVFVSADVGYSCPITGEPITSKKAHEENLARHGCRVLETGETQSYTEKLRREDEELENRISETAEAFVESLSSEAREQLGREIESGLDCTVLRQ